MSNAQFGRLITAMITPFDPAGAVDMEQSIHIADYLVENGTETILVAGTTGESPTLTHDEEYALFDAMVKRFKGKVPIMAGTGSNSTRTAIAASQKAEQIGVDALLQVVPYYNKPSQEGMYQHFKAVAESVSIPIMLYNIPGRTGVNMLPETVARLASIPNIVSIKEAAGDVEQAKALRQVLPDDFLIYSGDDALTVDFMKAGAAGVVSVASHIAGRQIQEMMQAVVDEDWATAEQWNQRLMPLFEGLFLTSNPVPVKHAMRLLGFAMGAPRLPLVDLTDEEAQKVEVILDSYLESVS